MNLTFSSCALPLLIAFFVVIVYLIQMLRAEKSRVTLTLSHCEQNELRVAAEKAIQAACTTNPLVALIECTRAIQMIESLHARHGTGTLFDTTGVDSTKLEQVLIEQKRRIMDDLFQFHPQYKTEHPLAPEAGMQ